jgi:hypothetical protein
MTREELIEVMADAIGEFMGAKDRLDAYHFDAANHLMRALEAAGVRLVPVEATMEIPTLAAGMESDSTSHVRLRRLSVYRQMVSRQPLRPARRLT